ncbi:AMP-binding protein [Pseudonocardia sp. CA-142604]|uniref:AMP-binding protein n=1 Tax=Pseudonocardia sp. CA-142604 TaxID=3240024 RepID=UPI003D8F9725
MSTNLMVRPSGTAARSFRAVGVWRDGGLISDLRKWRDETPDALAIKAYRADGEPVQIDYGEYARRVERFAGALYELGVRPGQVVACQLPNWWQAQVLLLAAARLGAVVAPIMTTIGARELERMLDRLDASVCVTVDEWAGFAYAAALREIAARLPRLQHRVVIGSPAEGEIEFESFFEATAWEQRHPVALDDMTEDPDRVAMVLFTSGTTGEPKAALHTQNTWYSTTSGLSEALEVTHQDVIFTPHSLMHAMGQIYSQMSLLVGACRVLLDSWSGERGLAVLADSATTQFSGAPSFVYDLIAATDGAPALPALRVIACHSTTVPKPLVAEVAAVFGVTLRAGWGMTEVGTCTRTRADDPADWAAYSDGRPLRGIELDLRSDTDITKDQPARLFVRGGGVCLATVGRDSGMLTVIADHDDGWYDTGDLAVPDGRGGIRLMGRVSDRIGGVFMIPVNDVESELLDHPAVSDVALVGYPDGQGGELACAVIVPATTPPVALDELRRCLSDKGMTDWFLPTRLEYLQEPPRNGSGKVRKELLRRWLASGADIPEITRAASS